ncbi:hypothetical protein [Actinomadura flavalba]|uniref:hypothetical protein n=1 Tax=Actinomadura flavalba TaxID=1120938 RepID=UPI00036694D4|nr:hypothetical protein [Actinomadura flavalba]
MSVEHVYELMGRAGALAYGEARSLLVEEALRHAEQHGDASLAFNVRMELGTAYQFGGEPIKTFTTFSRALADFDRAPGDLDGDAEHRLLWQFKWISTSLTLFPEVPLDRTYAVLDDMERRYRDGGHGLHAVYSRRARVARHLGDADAADHWFGLWSAAPHDDLSDCAGCDPSGKVAHLIWRGHDREALALAAPYLEDEPPCTEQPQGLLTALLPAYTRLGLREEARSAHLRAYRALRTQSGGFSSIDEHVLFCLRSGNEARGLEIVARHLDRLEHPPSPHAEMSFSAAAAALLRRIDEAGHGDRELGGTTVAELHPVLAERALALAARFDARNGTGEQSARTRARLETAPGAEHVPLTAPVRPAPVVPPAPEPITDPDAALDGAERAWRDGDPARAVAAWARFDELTAGTEPSPVRRARRLEGTGLERLMAGRPGETAEMWRRAADELDGCDEPERAATVRSRLGLLHARSGRPAEAETLLTETLAWLDAHAADRRRALTARLRLAEFLIEQERAPEASLVLGAAVPADERDVAAAELLRGRLLLGEGRVEDGAAALRASLTAARASGAEPLRAEPGLLLARALTHLAQDDLGRAAHGGEDADDTDPPDTERAEALLDEALDALDDAVTFGRHILAGFAALAHAERGGLLLRRGRPADAAADLGEAVAAFAALGDPWQATYARIDLAAAYLEAGRALEAAEVAEEALAGVPDLDDPDADRRCRLVIAYARKELREREAAEAFADLAELARAAGDTLPAAHFLEESAEALTAHDRDEDAAVRFVAAAETYALAGEPFAVVRTRRQAALCRWWSGDEDGAVTGLDDARAALADLPDDDIRAVTWETAVLDFDTARLFSRASRPAEALGFAESAVRGFLALDDQLAAAEATTLRDEITAALDTR